MPSSPAFPDVLILPMDEPEHETLFPDQEPNTLRYGVVDLESGYLIGMVGTDDGRSWRYVVGEEGQPSFNGYPTIGEATNTLLIRSFMSREDD